jgi:hypothetical protein
VITAKYIRGAMVLMALLLASVANLMDFSYDADHDETTPPVVLDLHFVVRAQRRIPQAVIPAQKLVRSHIAMQSPSRGLLAGSKNSPPQERSPQHQVPLLC